MCKQTSTNHL